MNVWFYPVNPENPENPDSDNKKAPWRIYVLGLFFTELICRMNCLISPFVIEEISKGDSKAAKRRLDAVSPFSILQVNEEIKELANTYFTALKLPEKAKLDASHLATAVWYQLDYLLSWNCKHIVSARVRKMVQEINAVQNLPTPIIMYPRRINGDIICVPIPLLKKSAKFVLLSKPNVKVILIKCLHRLPKLSNSIKID
jgi:lysyl-tRNA synthetase class II